jgi:arginase family enzyme
LSESVQITYVPSDGASRYFGAANTEAIWRAIVSDPNASFLPRHYGSLLPNLLHHRILNACARNALPLTIGGDHSLTWYPAITMASRYGRSLTILHLDAHHDAYPGTLLNNYTVFSAIKRQLGVSVVGAGYRHDVDPACPPVIEIPIAGPTYISIDVDFFDPTLVPSVGHAVPTRDGQSYDLESFQENLQKVHGPVVGADIVEWHGALSDTREYRFIRDVFRVLFDRLARDANPNR